MTKGYKLQKDGGAAPRLNVSMSSGLFKLLRKAAADSEKSVSGYVRDLIVKAVKG